MRSADGEAMLITAKSTYGTVEKFASLFNSLGVNIQIPRQAPLIEVFDKVNIPTRKGINYFDIETYVPPSTLEFTYY